MSKANRIFDFILNVMAVLACTILVGLMLATVYKVGLRELTGQGIIGVDQLSGTAMVYMTFFGAAWVLRNNGHVTIDLLVSSTGGRSGRNLVILNSLIGALVCFLGTYFGITATWSSWQRGIVVAAELEILRAYVIAPIPLGFFLLGVEFLRRAARARAGAIDTSIRMEA
ncbi:TRAP transporter small permease [Pseudohoeflea coraliihabitans]|uniref:TRAP transporter small permease protein n=1 Tax=Pseudohoeflea coraliihabitans TaxID=2860393 RepID=A0ABS6WIS6_9HYPH|nr:TRAP transporter small permease subunit [Pseudohoeflea sp. DP4N28-3]MBW3095837.1 TRAP transporter small permease subunit [Pseudohoeflea sp. DP4N28-3]